MATNVSSVTNHFPKPQDGFTTTTSGAVSSGGSTVGLNSTGNYSNGDIVCLIIDPTDSNKKQAFVGVIDTGGVQVTGVVWTSGTDQSHASGATVVDFVAATHLQMVSKGILVEHNQDGTHDESLIISRTEDISPASGDFVLTSDVSASNALKKVQLSNLLPNGTVTPSKLDAGAGSSWVWQSWTPTFVNLSGGTLNYARYTQIGKTIHFRLKYTLAGAGVAGAVTFTTPTSIHSDLNSTSETIHGSVTLQDTGTAAYPGILRWGSSTTISIHPIGSAGNYVNIDNLSSTIPHTWANTDIITAAGAYEPA